jgi:RNA polymerase sigma-70 factor (ECF subfamily)
MQAVETSTPQHDDAAVQARQEAAAWLSAIALHRDRQAFARLYARFAPKVKSYMIRQGADGASADDLTQETMAQIWRKAGQYAPEKAAPSSWIFRIARNLQIDRLRRQKFHEVELDAQAEQPEEGTGDHDRLTEQPDADRLRQLVDDLPTDQMEVVKLAFFEGLTHSEIGQQLSVPLGTVKSRLRLAFGKLRAGMGEVT